MKKSDLARSWAIPSVSPFFGAVAGYFVACLALGGGTRDGFLADLVLQALAVPLLLWAGWPLIDVVPGAGRGRARVGLAVCLLATAVPLAQLVPLPPSVWASLPQRQDFEASLIAGGLEVGWLPLSVAPSLTWLSGLALLPPMAVFLGVLQLGYVSRRRLSVAVLIVGLISVAIGLLQVAQGPTSPLRFYAFTNTSEAVGFFANRNHYSALLYCLVLIAAAWTVTAASAFARSGRALTSRRSTPHIVALLMSFAVLVVLVGAQAMARSRAGLALTIVAVFGAFVLANLPPKGDATPRPATARSATRWLMAAISLAVLFGVQFALYRIQERFELDPLEDARLPFARNTIEAAIAYMPFGSGMGTFVPVYQAFEKATDNVASVYANRAHNDFLEFWLETGLFGVVAMAAFVAWVFWASWRTWRHGVPGGSEQDQGLACAAALALILLLAHSVVDYPLRTTALMAVAAWALAMIVAPVGEDGAVEERLVKEARAARSRRRRRLQLHPSDPSKQGAGRPPEATEPDSRPFVPAPPREDWPAAWQPLKPPRSDE